MDDYPDSAGMLNSGYFTNRGRRRKVLLREPERCQECNGVYLSLYPLRECADHEGLERLF
jgi:hypothetical protein